MPTDNFSQNDAAVLAPYTRAVAVTPNDTTDLDEVTRALNVHASSGNHVEVAVILEGDTTSVILYLANSRIFPIRARRVLSTGTTAANVIALY